MFPSTNISTSIQEMPAETPSETPSETETPSESVTSAPEHILASTTDMNDVRTTVPTDQSTSRKDLTKDENDRAKVTFTTRTHTQTIQSKESKISQNEWFPYIIELNVMI